MCYHIASLSVAFCFFELRKLMKMLLIGIVPSSPFRTFVLAIILRLRITLLHILNSIWSASKPTKCYRGYVSQVFVRKAGTHSQQGTPCTTSR